MVCDQSETWTVTTEGSKVSVTVDCADAYAAIILADTILKNFREGHLHLYWTRPPLEEVAVRPRIDWGGP